MPIRFKKYIDITSLVGATSTVGERDLIGRLFTTNPLLPTSSYIEFDTAAEVASYFGTASVEYARALFYFSWINKIGITPPLISFARWTDANQAPMIFGETLALTLNQLKLITAGSFSLTLGGVTNVISGLNFSGANSLAAVAALIEDGIQAKTGTMWTAATVSYNATSGGFDFVGGSQVVANVIVAAGPSNDIATSIGWFPQSVNGGTGAIWSDGNLAESITTTLTNSAQASDNFGTFLFVPALTDDQNVEAGTWTKSQNVKFEYACRVTSTTLAQTYCNPTTGLMLGLDGVSVIFSPLSNQFIEQASMMIKAATPYELPNSVQNYMYQIFSGITPSVTTDSVADELDAINVNYYGVTQTAGQLRAFFQDGVLQGSANAPRVMSNFANEQWLKDACGVALMNQLLILSRLPANDAGVGLVLATLQSVINRALSNGTISVQGVLSEAQKSYVTSITQDPKAWYQVQSVGYWVDARIETYEQSDVTKYRISYTLVYKKDDVVSKIVGTDILI